MSDLVRVLLVEDNPADARLLRTMLAGTFSPSYEVTHAERMADALQQIGAGPFQVVLLDLSLPDVRGLETLSTLHAQAAQIPIVVLTGLDDEILAIEAVRQGAQDYLVKGKIDRSLLMRAVRYAIERKRLEEQLRHAQRMESVGRLAGGIAHDFNNLLTVVMTHTDLLLTRLHPEDPLVENVKEIESAAEQATSMTRQLLAFSRQQVLLPQSINLNSVVSRMVSMLRRLIGEDIELATVLQMGLKLARVDPGQIKQVVLNLVLNARDAMPHGGKLTIETTNVKLGPDYPFSHAPFQPGEYIMLAVSDTGHGMDAETLSHIFEPFFTTKSVGKGTGLGLATVYGIVQQSGGQISVHSEPGKGASFKVYFPLAPEAVEDEQPAETGPANVRGTETVLVVEDHVPLRAAVKSILQSNGYKVLEVCDGNEALDLCEHYEGGVDLLVTDVVMPKMSGREVAERLTSLQPRLKVLFMSGYPNGSIVHHGMLDTGVAFLPKPFKPDDLARKVREVLDAEPAPVGERG